MSFVEARQHLNGIQLVKFWGVRGMGEGTVKKQFFRVYQFFAIRASLGHFIFLSLT